MRCVKGQVVGQGLSGKKFQLGVRMIAADKKSGCSNLKPLIEDDMFVTCEYEVNS